MIQCFENVRKSKKVSRKGVKRLQASGLRLQGTVGSSTPGAWSLRPEAWNLILVSFKQRSRSAYRHTALVAIIPVLLFAGCSESINTEYGRRGEESLDSVNGTTVFSEMFERAGHDVRTARRLSSRVKNSADVIVWIPVEFTPPTPEIRESLEDWLLEEPGRTLIYVGRDFDASVAYWRKMRNAASPAEASEISRRLATASSAFQSERQLIPVSEDVDWFTVEGTGKPILLQSLSGEEQWMAGIDPSKTEIELYGRIVPPPDAEILLASDEDVVVSRQQWGDSQLIVVANGSFLLNLPLVNHEHRKLAGHLIDEIGEEKNVVFLESSLFGTTLVGDEAEINTGTEFFGIWPLEPVLLHLAALGMLFLFSRLPIFGIPDPGPPGEQSDFGQHVIALGELLAQSRDQDYAVNCLLHYQHNVKSDSGAVRGGGERARLDASKSNAESPARETQKPLT